MTYADINWIANYIWGICDDVLRDLYTSGKYRDVSCPQRCCAGSMSCLKAPSRTSWA